MPFRRRLEGHGLKSGYHAIPPQVLKPFERATLITWISTVDQLDLMPLSDQFARKVYVSKDSSVMITR